MQTAHRATEKTWPQRGCDAATRHQATGRGTQANTSESALVFPRPSARVAAGEAGRIAPALFASLCLGVSVVFFVRFVFFVVS